MSFFEGVKVLLSDKRGRALVKFGIYIIFIVFAVTYVRAIHETREVKPVVDSYTSQTTYKETIKFLDKEYELENNVGIRFKDKEEYTVISNTVYKENEKIDYDFYFWNLTPKFIGELVSDKEAYSETKYKDSSIEKTYKISLIEFIEKFDGKELNLEEYEDNEITITIKKMNDKVVSVYLDLTNYYSFIDDEKLEVYITY